MYHGAPLPLHSLNTLEAEAQCSCARHLLEKGRPQQSVEAWPVATSGQGARAVPVACPEAHLAASFGTSTPAALRSIRCTSSKRARSDAVDMRPVSSRCCRAAITAPCDPCTGWVHSLVLWRSNSAACWQLSPRIRGTPAWSQAATPLPASVDTDRHGILCNPCCLVTVQVST